MISAGGHFTKGQFVSYKGAEYKEEDETKLIPVDGVFLYGKKDLYRKHFISHTLYSGEKLVLWYDGGHQFPKELGPDEHMQLRDFLKR